MSTSTTAITAITVMSVTSEDDARTIPPVPDPKELKLNVLRQKLGVWMSPTDSFLTALKGPVDLDSESEWSAADLWAGGTLGKILIRRAAPPPAVRITVKSVADAGDLYVIPPVDDPKKFMLDVLRKTLGEWLTARDQFLDKTRTPIDSGQESKRSVADVATDSVVLISRVVQSFEIKVQRDGTEIGSAVRVVPNAKLNSVRRLLEGRGDMSADDAFVDAEGTDQVPLGNESSRSIQSALKNKVLTITSRADWS
jgi:hypothetical protein